MSVQLDENDARIIELLQEDGRMQYKDIAQRVGVSIPTARSRIQRLLGLGVIKKFTVIVDADKILGKVRGIVLLQVSPSKVDRVVARLAAMKEVREVYKTAGPDPLVAKVEAKDLDSLGQLVSDRFSGIEGISGISSFVVTRTGKEEYGASVEAQAMVQFKCSFCGAPILGKPYLEYIDGGRYYFNAEGCAAAYKQNLRKEKGG